MSSAEASDIEEVEAILAIAQEHDLDSLSVTDGDWELHVTRREETPGVLAAPVAAPITSSSVPVSNVAPAAPPDIDGAQVLAPIIGVFYRAPAPSAPPFVNVGDRVSIGQPLCILEAMKLMNEITSDHAGVITAIHVENGDLITIGQPIFTVSPSA